MDTGKNYKKLVYGSGISKITAQISTINNWLQHPKMKESQKLSKRPKIIHYADFLSSMLIHGSTLDDYITFEFYKKSFNEKKAYLTGKKQHKFLDKVNDKNKTDVFIDKIKFSETFSDYLGREMFVLDLENGNIGDARKWLSNKDIVFAKPSKGIHGKGVTRFIINNNIEEIISYCSKNNLDIIEEMIIQHSDLNYLYPDSINTVRFMTYVVDGGVRIIGATLRLGNGGYVDNAASGGVFASIDTRSGIVNSVAYNRLGEKNEKHPITNKTIKGFQIPFWEEVIEIGKKAALEIPEVGCVGWDVAISVKGPLIIEANDRWGRFVWQLPAEKGLHHLIK